MFTCSPLGEKLKSLDSCLPTEDDSEQWEMEIVESFRTYENSEDDSGDLDCEICETPLPESEMSLEEVPQSLMKIKTFFALEKSLI
jgi:hypothetical protein